MRFLFALVLATMIVSPVLSAPGSSAKREPRVDSVVYDKATEWKAYPTDGPVVAFTVEGPNLWSATAQTVTQFSIKTGAPVRPAKIGDLEPAGVIALATDSSGNVWFGSKNGVAVKIKNAYTTFTADQGLISNAVTCICPTRDNGVWVGTEAGVSVYSGGSWKNYTSKQGLTADQVNCLVSAGRTIWVGTPKGICSFDGAKWTPYTMAMDQCLSWNETRALAWDPRTGTLWAAVGDQDVNNFNGKAWNVFMNIAPGIMSIMADSQSRLWFGHPAGLVKFNGEEWISDAARHGVPASQVSTMYRDHAGNLWFASEKGVIFLTNPYPF